MSLFTLIECHVEKIHIRHFPIGRKLEVDFEVLTQTKGRKLVNIR